MIDINTKIKEWYQNTYPEDLCGVYVNENATFYGLFEALDSYKDVYEYIGVNDSVIRERCFDQLARLIHCDYGYIYDQWLRG